MTVGKANASKRLKPLVTIRTDITWLAKPNIKRANYLDRDDMINDKVAKNMEDGVDDINSGRTYAPEQVKKMLGLQ